MSELLWSATVGGLVVVIGLVAIVVRGAHRTAKGFDKLILLGPLFYGAPLAAFGTEHFTLTKDIASLVPSWMPWPEFWTYVIGAGFIAAGVSMVIGFLARVAAILVAATFFVFVVAMDAPAWAHNLDDRIGMALTLRELAFSGGALALAASLSGEDRVVATIARYCVAVPVLVYGVLQFLYADHVPGVPLKLLTPSYVIGHALWTYLAAAVYLVAGVVLVLGRYRRAAAVSLGATVLLVVLVVYLPILVVEGGLVGFNYFADTLMFCGAILLLARAMPRER